MVARSWDESGCQYKGIVQGILESIHLLKLRMHNKNGQFYCIIVVKILKPNMGSTAISRV